MSLNFTVQPGKIFAEGEKPTTAKLNQLGVPVIAAEGVIGPADMGPGDYAATLGAGASFAASVIASPVERSWPITSPTSRRLSPRPPAGATPASSAS
jgi:hypothetical protein